TSRTWNVGSTYDLYTVAMHEFGHSLGLGHSVSGTVMYASYQGVKAGLAADDVTKIDAVYGARSQDVNDTFAPNDSFAATTDLSGLIDPFWLTALANILDVTTPADTDWYTLLTRL